MLYRFETLNWEPLRPAKGQTRLEATAEGKRLAKRLGRGIRLVHDGGILDGQTIALIDP